VGGRGGGGSISCLAAWLRVLEVRRDVKGGIVGPFDVERTFGGEASVIKETSRFICGILI